MQCECLLIPEQYFFFLVITKKLPNTKGFHCAHTGHFEVLSREGNFYRNINRIKKEHQNQKSNYGYATISYVRNNQLHFWAVLKQQQKLFFLYEASWVDRPKAKGDQSLKVTVTRFFFINNKFAFGEYIHVHSVVSKVWFVKCLQIMRAFWICSCVSEHYAVTTQRVVESGSPRLGITQNG